MDKRPADAGQSNSHCAQVTNASRSCGFRQRAAVTGVVAGKGPEIFDLSVQFIVIGIG
jgi:hypothetical protein